MREHDEQQAKVFDFFSQSSQLAMHNVLQNDSEYIMQLAALSSSLNVRHRQSKSIR